jgi:hypothetical protein
MVLPIELLETRVEQEALAWSLSGVDLGEEVLEVGPGQAPV